MIPKLLYRFQTYPHRPSKIDPKTDKVIDRYGEVFDWKIWICFVRWCENWTLNWLSSLLLHKTHDDKNLFFFWRCPFYSVLTSIKKYIRIDAKSLVVCVIRFKLESALKKKLKLSKHHISSKEAAAEQHFV